MIGGDPAQRAAFLATTYGTPGERFRLSEARGPAPSWARERWAVVTAWNPGGRRARNEDNARAGADLLARVTAAGLSPLPALNGEGEWEEEALIVPGATLRQATDWGREFGQAAVLWGMGARVALVWLSPGVPVERFWARL
ncbi:DUF3293 domain-containing protein [Deinococcus planocerae]|uniref:DUF3293 domain-containing protein n=1 Tax=Deinococcus planocerae TaxID=1737569 RepID=UPI001FEC7BFE|nr:DUF3293 domain-containing protein [Deinococcus planocerae]